MTSRTKLPRLTLRVAVTGHRPNKIDAHRVPVIRAAVRAVLEEIDRILHEASHVSAKAGRRGYSREEPLLRILSSLAEGADRIVPEEAIALFGNEKVQLECPLPAARAEYRKDFQTEESRREFDRLLDIAKRVFELDGQRAGQWLRSKDYGHAGHMCLSHTDVLIAIWDGKWGEEGGTGRLVEAARHLQIPVVWINADDPADIRMRTGREAHRRDWRRNWRDTLRVDLEALLEAPVGSGEWVRDYLSRPLSGDIAEARRPDVLASRYSGWFRVSYRFKYGLSAFAVLFSAAGQIPGIGDHWWWAALELASIGLILVCFIWPKSGEWHDLWLDYRLLAEQLRVVEFLEPMGETAPVFHPPKYWGTPARRHECVRWYFRALQREQALPSAVADAAFVEARRAHVRKVIRGQIRYNAGTHKRAKFWHKGMEKAGYWLFGATAALCLLHLVLHVGEWGPKGLLVVLGTATAGLPAFGAAMEGLQAQEEAKRIADHTNAMGEHMREVLKLLDNIAEPGLEPVREVAVDLAIEMTRETSGWHNLIHGQGPRM